MWNIFLFRLYFLTLPWKIKIRSKRSFRLKMKFNTKVFFYCTFDLIVTCGGGTVA